MDVAVIADIVGSRRLPDRADAQRALALVAAAAEEDLPLATEALRATVGDELQARYPSLDAALAGILLVQLTLPEGLGLRFGIGVGTITDLATGSPALQDGPAWWAARKAIEEVHARQQRAVPSSRIAIVGAPEEDESMHRVIASANAYVLVRDELVGRMSARERRLVHGRCLGRTQAELARSEGISQPGVSQALARAGAAAVAAGFDRLIGGVA